MPRALVTEVNERGALEACRALHAAGYEVVGVAQTRLAPGHWSRAVKRRLRLPSPRVDEDGFVEGLAGAVDETRADVLVPGGEGSMLAISRRRDRFEGVLHGLPPDEVVQRALDKLELLEVAQACGFTAPPGEVCSTVQDALAAARRLGYPVGLKPPRSIVRSEQGLRQQTIAIAADEAALEEAAAASATPFVVQTFVTDPVRISVAGVLAGGELRALAVARYLRVWPPRAGSACCAETIEPAADLVERVEALLRAVGWEGIFELELLDLPEGLAAIDLNPRVFGWMALARHAGANLPRIWCDWLRGSARPLVSTRAGVTYRWEDAELMHVVRNLLAGRVREARQILRPRPGTVHGYVRLRDPAPLVAHVLDVAARAVSR